MDVHAVVRTDLMFGTNVFAGLRSLKYMKDGVGADLDNGNVVKLVEIIRDEDGNVNDREVWKAEDVAADTPIDEIVLVATPELHYDERKKMLNEFYNEAGKIARGYVLHHNDIFSVTAEALEGVTDDTAPGAAVALKAGTKLEVGGSGTAIGKLIDIETIKNTKFYVIEID